MIKRLFIVVISVILITSCIVGDGTQNNASSRDTLYQDYRLSLKHNKDDFFLFRCLWQDIDDCIEESEFCVIAQVIITNDEPIPSWVEKLIRLPLKKIAKPKIPNDISEEALQEIFKKYQQELIECPMLEVYPRSLFRREGKLKIQSIIYGNPETEEIPFSYEYNDKDIGKESDRSDRIPWLFRRSHSDYLGLAHFLYSEPTSIVLGKGKGKDIKILRAIGESLQLISPQAIKEWKELIKKGPPTTWNKDWFSEIERRQQDWLLNSNNQDLLLLSFIRRLHEYYLDTAHPPSLETGTGLSKAIELIDTLSNKGIDTTERRFLAYGLSLFGFYEFTEENRQFPGVRPPAIQMNDNQRQVLLDIASQKFTRITNPKEGIKYLRLISLFTYDVSYRLFIGGPFNPFEEIRGKESKLFARAPGLKDKLQPIAITLSERFKNDPDYPEWAKWVNKIFPADNK